MCLFWLTPAGKCTLVWVWQSEKDKTATHYSCGSPPLLFQSLSIYFIIRLYWTHLNDTVWWTGTERARFNLNKEWNNGRRCPRQIKRKMKELLPSLFVCHKTAERGLSCKHLVHTFLFVGRGRQPGGGVWVHLSTKKFLQKDPNTSRIGKSLLSERLHSRTWLMFCFLILGFIRKI